MKKLHLFLFVAALSCLAMGCRKPVEVSFGVESLNIAAEGGTYTTELKSNGEWSLGAAEEWLTVTPTSGNGNATLTFEAQPNTSAQPRSIELHATTKDNTATMTIAQEGTTKYITLSPSSMLGDWEGGSFQVDVRSNVAWTVTASPEWVTCSVMEGEGDVTLWMTMHPFTEPGNREDYVTFEGGNITAQFHIKQSGTSSVQHFLYAVPEELHVPYTGDVKTLTLACDEAWVALLDAEWTVLDKTEGEGNDFLMLTVAENPLIEARQAAIKFISESQNTIVVNIFQEGAPDMHFLEVTPTELTFGHEGGSQDVSIDCDVGWTVQLDDDWLSLSTMGGTGSGILTITVEPNIYGESRQAAMNIASGNLNRRIMVTQEPGEMHLVANVSPDTLYVAQTGGVKMFEVTSNTSWMLSAPSWITILETSGTGDATVEMMVGANPAHSSRIGYIDVMRNGVELASVVVVQDGVPSILSADVEEIVFTREGGSQYFHLTSNLSWEIENTAEWLVCNPSVGTGNADVQVKVLPMEGLQSREEVLVIRGDYGTMIYVIVRQTN